MLKSLSFKLGYKYSFSSSFSDKYFLSIISFLSKNLLHSDVKKLSLLQLILLNSSSNSSFSINPISDDDDETLTVDEVDGTLTEDFEEVSDDETLTVDEVDGTLIEDFEEVSDDEVVLFEDEVLLDEEETLLDDEELLECFVDELLLSSDLSLGKLDSSSDDSTINNFFFGLSVIILYIMNIIYILVILY
jgi:hypothetical protein